MHKKKKNIGGAIATMLMVLVMAGLGIWVFVLLQQTENDKDEISKLMGQQDSISRVALVAVRNISEGEVLTVGVNIEQQLTYSGFSRAVFWDGIDDGIAAIPIEAGTPILNSMLISDTEADGLWDIQYACIDITDNIKTNDYVDILIGYPDGTEYVVAAKKRIKSMADDYTKVVLNLSREDVLMIRSAIVDAYLYAGTQIYMYRYSRPTIQSSSVVTYTPSVQSSNLIHSDPNISEVASTYLAESIRHEREAQLDEFERQNSDVTQGQSSSITNRLGLNTITGDYR